MPNPPTPARSRRAASPPARASTLVTPLKRPWTEPVAFPGDWWLSVPGRPGSLPSLGHREEKYDLLETPAPVHGRMAAVTANRSLRIALVARRHIDLKRVCSCCCLP
ncbi:Ms4527A family Cys-rich leader peptide [Mycobacterium terramassiliense]|uniref:Ms4527A family Cys-rich leader peptide n=1 Tax=Mycobacterium terramassiliense TaxID=1841859 RepID=UPI003CCB77AA